MIKKLMKMIFPSKETRAYRKMHRKHTRELIKLVKADREWDWEYLHILVVTKIRHMHEYFTAGNCMMECEETPNIIAELKHVLDLQERIDTQAPHCLINEQDVKLYQEIYQCIAQNLLGWWD